MSPQQRRGRAAPASRRKPSSSVASAPARKSVPAAEGVAEGQLDEAKRAPVRPGRRQRGLARVRRTAAYKYLYELFGAYVPLLVAFVILFAAVWVWISFGPHTPTAKQNWTRIENQWLPKVDGDRQKIAATRADFKAQIAAYTTYRDDIRGWTGALDTVTNWEDANETIAPDAADSTPTGDAVNAFVEAGNQEASDLDVLVRSTTPGAVADAVNNTVSQDEDAFQGAYQAVELQIVGATPSAEPTLSVPSLSPCSTAAASAGPGSSGTPAASASPSVSAAAASAGPAPSGSPSASATPGASASDTGWCAPPVASESPGASDSTGP